MKAILRKRLHSSRCATRLIALTAGLGAISFCVQATELAVNGNFEDLLEPGVSAQFGSLYPTQQPTGWTTVGYNFVFTPDTADSTGATGQYGKLALWGPNNGVANGLTDSPAGGNFVAMDGAFEVAPIEQMITGLTPGENTTVSFYFAGAQQQGFSGATTEQFKVSLGSQTAYTPVLQNVTHGFTGWNHESFTFIPTAAEEVLSFLAIGTPDGVPPFSLLDGVSVTSAPEPGTTAVVLSSLLGLFGLARMRRGKR